MDIASLHQLFLNHQTICTDTRKIEKNCLFFALKGENFNANQFANQALSLGAAYAIIDEEEYKTSDKFILVNDVLSRLQQLASFHRDTLKIPVIAIAGSNGKTTTKELITAVLNQKFNVLSTFGNFNNHIGVPLTLLQINKLHQIAVIEMGANHVGENEFLCEIAKPSHGIITNNGKDHLEGFGGIDGVAKSNSELYNYLLKNNGIAFVNLGDDWLMRMAEVLVNKITYSANFNKKNGDAHYSCHARTLQPTINFYIEGFSESVQTCLSGDYNFDNITAAVAVGLFFGVSESEIVFGIENYKPSNNRSEVIKKIKNTIYLDAYNANPSSMEVSVKNFAAMPFGNKIVILGDMFELGKYAEEEHQNLIDYCTSLGFVNVFLCGPLFKNTSNKFLSFSTTQACKDYLTQNKLADSNIFMKGSRGMKLETLMEVID
jgi:UDP-N-acetylmuramoyl-tripeptide--D-alanyl-D-alanine ligase